VPRCPGEWLELFPGKENGGMVWEWVVTGDGDGVLWIWKKDAE